MDCAIGPVMDPAIGPDRANGPDMGAQTVALTECRLTSKDITNTLHVT